MSSTQWPCTKWVPFANVIRINDNFLTIRDTDSDKTSKIFSDLAMLAQCILTHAHVQFGMQLPRQRPYQFYTWNMNAAEFFFCHRSFIDEFNKNLSTVTTHKLMEIMYRRGIISSKCFKVIPPVFNPSSATYKLLGFGEVTYHWTLASLSIMLKW